MPKKLLSIDGGGIRGIIPCSILANMEKDLGKPVHDIFDFFAGTSIGGIMSIGFCYPRLTAEWMLNNIFIHENASHIMNRSVIDKIFGIFQFSPKYNGVGKTQMINKFLPEMDFCGTSDKLCLIPTYDIESKKPVFFKNWIAKYNADIRDIAKQTSAAPSYFPGEYISLKRPDLYGKDGIWGIDGGIVAGNPSDCAIIAMINLGLNDMSILSLGTGFTREIIKDGSDSRHWGTFRWVKNNLIDIFMEAPEEASEYRASSLANSLNSKYLRINESLENTNASGKIDNTDKDNIKALIDVGNEWYQKNRNTILRTYDGRIDSR